MIEVKTVPVMDENKLVMQAKFSMDQVTPHLQFELLLEAARLIAAQYVSEHYQEIVAKISPDAIATLTAAECASKIRETLEKNIPHRILEVEKTRTEVWQRGILGGMTRLK